MNKHTIAAATATGVLALIAGTIGGGIAGTGIGHATAPTPEACLMALDEGERALDVSAEALGLAGDGVVAAAAWDYVELNRITAELERLNEEIEDPSVYLDAAADCRGEVR